MSLSCVRAAIDAGAVLRGELMSDGCDSDEDDASMDPRYITTDFLEWVAMFEECDTGQCQNLTHTVTRSYYFDLISYVGARRRRLQLFKEDAAKRQVRCD